MIGADGVNSSVRSFYSQFFMTPISFLAFRDELNPASGFQSMQFREIEFSSGLKDERILREFASDPYASERLQKRFEAASVAEAFYLALERRGFKAPVDRGADQTQATHNYHGLPLSW